MSFKGEIDASINKVTTEIIYISLNTTLQIVSESSNKRKKREEIDEGWEEGLL